MKPNTIKNGRVVGGFLRILDENGPTLAMVGSIAGMIAALYSAYKKAEETAEAKFEYNDTVAEIMNDNPDMSVEEKKKEIRDAKIHYVVKITVINKWAIGSAVAAGGLAFLSNYLNGRKIAGLAAALALSEEKLKKLTDKAKELMSSPQFEELMDKHAEEMLKDPDNDRPPWEVNDNLDPDKLFYDNYFGCLLELPESQVLDAITKAEKLTFLRGNEWRGLLGMDPAQGYTMIGWGPKNRFKAHIGTRMLGGCLVNTIEYDCDPVPLSQRKDPKKYQKLQTPQYTCETIGR